ncbi:cupin domain-containing protein [Kitasatospora sp. NPDC058965]|uniref:cupin domain-containing protein n=1 Tax=Kitasatospora sp. NPDC058965 TaxID=3346682 RepID=UPI00369A51AC
MTIRHREPEQLERAHGLDLRLLHPWADLSTPFRGAWCVLRPGDVTEQHSHRERELFVCMAGRGVLATAGERHDLAAGDLALMRAGVDHWITNEHDEDFVYYAIWWDRVMAAEYLDEPGRAR